MGFGYVRTFGFLAAAMLAGCGGSGDSGSTASFGGSRAPKRDSLLGNWLVQKVEVVADTNSPQPVRDGSSVRVSNTGPIEIAGLYVGPNSARRRFIELVLRGTYEEKKSVSDGSYEYELVTDFGPGLNIPTGVIYDRFSSNGKLVDGRLEATYLFQSFAPRVNGLIIETERDEVRMTCVPGTPLQSPTGDWAVRAIEVLEDTGTPHDIREGQTLTVANRELRSIFGKPFTADKWQRANPELQIVDRFSYASNGAVQGFLAGIGRAGTKRAGEGTFVLVDFAITGSELFGSYIEGITRPASDEVDELLIRMTRTNEPNAHLGSNDTPTHLLATYRRVAELRRRLQK